MTSGQQFVNMPPSSQAPVAPDTTTPFTIEDYSKGGSGENGAVINILGNAGDNWAIITIASTTSTDSNQGGKLQVTLWVRKHQLARVSPTLPDDP
ncbi:unnamed protein product [Dibothriocephalus latus]|uniref:Uncharacterized protein n=1 Tax=Dibothriocephalus latus TaxID=60516 RepID=A0A3P7LW05_DIBLA|nr:unnamed protein product [Dibothriocephalus latus]